MAKTHGGKGSGVAQGYRTKQYEESKLWENIKKKEQKERVKCSCGEASFKLNEERVVSCSSCESIIVVPDADYTIVFTESSDADIYLKFNGDSRKNYEEYKKKELKRANKQIEEAERLKIELNSDHNIKVCNNCGEYKILDDFEDTKSKYYLRLPYHKGKRIRCRECEKELVG